MQDCKQDPAV